MVIVPDGAIVFEGLSMTMNTRLQLAALPPPSCSFLRVRANSAAFAALVFRLSTWSCKLLFFFARSMIFLSF